MASFTRLAQAALTAQIKSVGANPIQRDAETGGPTVQGEESDDIVAASKLGIVVILALAALGTGWTAFYFVSSALVDFSSILTMIFGVGVVVQKRALAKLGTFRHHHNQMRLAVGNVRFENERLERTVDKLAAQTRK